MVQISFPKLGSVGLAVGDIVTLQQLNANAGSGASIKAVNLNLIRIGS